MNKERLSILISDDETLARERIKSLLLKVDKELLLYEASSGTDTIKLINENEPDLLFLDIQMADMSGFDVLAQLNLQVWPIIIFVTAFDSFAVNAFEVQAIDFLLKPYSEERFNHAYERAVQKIATEKRMQELSKLKELKKVINNELPSAKQTLKTLVLKLKNKYYFIETTDIKYIISSGYYMELYTIDNQKHLHRISMSELIVRLDESLFLRINRSTIVNVKLIREVISEGGGFSIFMQDGKYFSLTKSYRDKFMKQMNIR